MPLRHISASLVALAAMAGTIAGCGGSSATSKAANAGGPPGHAAVGNHAITIADFTFAPGSLSVARGARITVANRDGTAHTATADDGHSFDTGDIAPGASATVAVTKPGTYTFHCAIHSFMHGTLVVR